MDESDPLMCESALLPRVSWQHATTWANYWNSWVWNVHHRWNCSLLSVGFYRVLFFFISCNPHILKTVLRVASAFWQMRTLWLEKLNNLPKIPHHWTAESGFKLHCLVQSFCCVTRFCYQEAQTPPICSLMESQATRAHCTGSVQFKALPLTGCVTLGMSPDLSVLVSSAAKTRLLTVPT